MFTKGPFDEVAVRSDCEQALREFYAAVKLKVGDKASLSCFAFRLGASISFQIRANGSNGSIEIELTCGETTQLPLPEEILDIDVAGEECEVVDAVDAFYLIEGLRNALKVRAIQVDLSGHASIPNRVGFR